MTDYQQFAVKLPKLSHILALSGLREKKKNDTMTIVHNNYCSAVTSKLSLIHAVQVFNASAFVVTDGVNLGDSVSAMEELSLDDVYRLDPDATWQRLQLRTMSDGSFRIARNTEVGHPGAELHPDCLISLMSPDGRTYDAIVLVELDDSGHVAQVYLLPTAPLVAKMDYTLVSAERTEARRKFAEIACVSFSRGTRITMADGQQKPVEELFVGDRVLTRDGGPQEIRWVGQSTVRAAGAMAPIMIKAGALHNERDLIVSPDHRLFVYQRLDALGVGKNEILVKARHLVNDDSVVIMEGGYVDFFQILFDQHHLIYAEGIAAESLMVGPLTRPALPDELFSRFEGLVPNHASSHYNGLDVQQSLLDRPDALALLRRASTG